MIASHKSIIPASIRVMEVSVDQELDEMGSPKGTMRHLDLFPTLQDETKFLGVTPHQVRERSTSASHHMVTRLHSDGLCLAFAGAADEEPRGRAQPSIKTRSLQWFVSSLGAVRAGLTALFTEQGSRG